MATQDVHIHPLFLTYSSKDLEKQYSVHRKTSLLNVDWGFLQLNLVLHFLFVLAECFQFIESTNYVSATIAAVSGFCLVLLQWGLMTFKAGKLWAPNRTLLLVSLRAARLITFSIGAPLWFGREGDDIATLIKNMMLRSGSLKATWLAFGMPLMFKHHLPLQVVSVVSLAFATHGQLLDTTCRSGADPLMQAWRGVNTFLRYLAGSSFSRYTSRDSDPTNVACGHVLVLIHFLVGFMVPSLALWRFELASRRTFARNLPPSDDSPSAVRVLSHGLPTCLQVVAFVVVGTSIAWTLASDLFS